MRIQFSLLRSTLATRIALAAALSGLATGCSADATRLSSPLFSGATENQRATIDGTRTDRSGEYTGSITKRAGGGKARKEKTLLDLLRLPERKGKVETVPADSRIASRPADYTRASGNAAAQGGGWTAAGGTVITVRDGDTLYSISRRYGVPAKEVMRANSMSDPGQIRAGQRIVIPNFVYGPEAPVSAPDAGHGGRIARLEAGRYPRPTANPRRGRRPAGPLITASISRKPGAVVVHKVEEGESLGGISLRYGVSRRLLMEVNGIENPDHIRIGQRLKIPAGSGAAGGRETVTTARRHDDMVDRITTGSISPVAVSYAARPPRKPVHTGATGRRLVAQGYRARGSGVVAVPIPVSRPVRRGMTGGAGARIVPVAKKAGHGESVTASKAVVSRTAGGGTNFRWPVRGRIIAGFGSTADGRRNDGINVAVPEGTSVKAAADGVVVYAGNELKGFGNLVLIKHADGWVTAYAHNSELLVQRGDRVSRGQIIGKAGRTGSVTSPQLHFQLRKGSKPVDPRLYLASS